MFEQIYELVYQFHSAKTTTWQVQELLNIPVQGYGMGRIVTLTEPITAAVLVERVKSHTGLPYVRLALPEGCAKADDHQVRTIALCAGSGGGVLRGVRAGVYSTRGRTTTFIFFAFFSVGVGKS